MQDFLPCLFGAVGLTLVVTLSHLAWPLRFFGCRLLRALGLKLPCPLYCSMCFGFWAGIIFQAFCPSNVSSLHVLGYDCLVMGLSTSAVAFLASTWLRSHGEHTCPSHDTRRWRRRLTGRQ